MRIISLIFLCLFISCQEQRFPQNLLSRNEISFLNQEKFLTNPVLPFTLETISEFRAFSLNLVLQLGHSQHSNYRLLDPNKKNPETHLIPPDIEDRFEFSQISQNEVIYTNKSESLKFIFIIDEAHQFTLHKIEGKFDLHSPNLIHFSQNADSFSFLVRNDMQLYAFYFVKETGALSPQPPSTYQFVWGNEFPIRFQTFQTLHVCLENESPKFIDQITSGLLMWKQVKMENFNYQVLSQTKCPPFSDVNFRGVYLFDTDQFEVTASTINLAQFSSNTMLDADIMLFKNQITKHFRWKPEKETLQFLKMVMGHEMGHFLGLGHEFGPERASIMSYDGLEVPTDFDYQALKELYR